MLLALVDTILVLTGRRGFEAFAVDGVELYIEVSTSKRKVRTGATHSEEGIVLFPTVVRAGRALRRALSIPRFSSRLLIYTHHLLEVLAEVGVVDLDGGGCDFGHGDHKTDRCKSNNSDAERLRCKRQVQATRGARRLSMCGVGGRDGREKEGWEPL